MDHRYDITSNRKSGEGRYDIQLMPKMKQDAGILIECKAADKASEQELHALAEAALEQIEERRYDTEMIARGMISRFKYGVAFSGKHAVVEMKQTPGKK